MARRTGPGTGAAAVAKREAPFAGRHPSTWISLVRVDISLRKDFRRWVQTNLCKIWKIYMSKWALNANKTDLGVVPVESAMV